jgi:hypothetical protein
MAEPTSPGASRPGAQVREKDIETVSSEKVFEIGAGSADKGAQQVFGGQLRLEALFPQGGWRADVVLRRPLTVARLLRTLRVCHSTVRLPLARTHCFAAVFLRTLMRVRAVRMTTRAVAFPQ